MRRSADLVALPLFPQFEEPDTSVRQSTAAGAGSRPVRIAPLALAALARATYTDRGDVVEVVLPAMTPELYAGIKPLLATCGVEWKSGAKAHFGSPDAVNALRAAIEAGSYVDSKRELEFFATAPAFAATLARELAENVYHESDQPRILEPSAGEGVLVAAVLTAIPGARITAVELDEGRAKKLRRRFAGDQRVRVIHGDVLALEEDGWDGVIANFPFAVALEHLQHVTALARRGAHVVAIASLGRREDAQLADFVHERCVWTEEVPASAFVDTKTRASWFGFRVESTSLDRLRVHLRPHRSLGETQIRALTRASRDIHQANEDTCNGVIENDEYDRRIAAIVAPVDPIVAPERIGLHFPGDPRAGYGLGLVLPSGATNDFGQSCVIVPAARRVPVQPAAVAPARRAA